MIAVLFGAFLFSCDNDEGIPFSSSQESSLVNDKSVTTRSMLRSGLTSVFAEVSPTKAKRGTMFSFKVYVPSNQLSNGTNLQICFNAPDGNSYKFFMRYLGEENGTKTFSFSRELSSVGIYRFEYGKSDSNGFTKLQGSSTYSLQVTSDAIPITDDLNSLSYGTLPKGQCVTWVAGKVNQMWGTTDFQDLLGASGRSATKWRDILSNQGYQYDLNPKVGDIAWWKTTNTGLGRTHGHVAFVNEVIDNNTVVITEYNYKSNVHGFRTLRRITKKVSEKFPHAFIHVQKRLN